MRPEDLLDPQIDIAMPCYNSAAWLDGMIESIVAQDGPSWRIIARDDGSQDATVERLAIWQERLGARMVLLENPSGENLRIAASYTAVLQATSAPWILTADPDDVWLPGHLARIADAIKDAESSMGTDVPIAVCTNAAVIDERDRPVASSFWRWVRSNPRRLRLLDVAMENPALGSTMGVNRALLDLALPVPRESGAQDWWLALTASAFGRLSVIEEVSILYRRHGGNHMKNPFGESIIDAVRISLAAPDTARGRIRQLLSNRIGPQATVFVDRYGSRLTRKDAEGLRALAALGRRGPFGRRISIIRHGFAFASPVKNLGMLVFC
jgi:glycosyltransferase involved in cell wall biosynthesis